MIQLYGHGAVSSAKREWAIAIVSPFTDSTLAKPFRVSAITDSTGTSLGSRLGIQAGTHKFGPENGTLWVRTGRTGAAAKAGHDLLIHVTAWQATVEVSEDPALTSIVLDADATSLRVREGIGGMQPLGDDDKASIQETIDDEVLKRMGIEFRSTAVQTAADGNRISVQGELTLVGNVRPIEFDLLVGDDGKLSGNVVVKQTSWGITPYSTLFGALKVADEVEVVINASFRRADQGHVDEEPEWSAPWEAGWRPAPIVDPRVSSVLWALVFFLYLWLGMVAVGVAHRTALPFALVASFFIFVFVGRQGVGRQD
jgi:polyisoprenoid-binding protein YceI